MPTPAPIVSDPAWIRHLRSQPCVITGQVATEFESVVPVHIGTAGKAIKNDAEALPILSSVHGRMHQEGEISTLRELAPNWLIREAFRAYARQLYAEWRGSQK